MVVIRNLLDGIESIDCCDRTLYHHNLSIMLGSWDDKHTVLLIFTERNIKLFGMVQLFQKREEFDEIFEQIYIPMLCFSNKDFIYFAIIN
jgi:hypothetical protein